MAHEHYDLGPTIPQILMVLLGLFGLWWTQADPKARLDKIEFNQLDNRKELNESISSIRKEIGSNYLTLREHRDLVDRLEGQLTQLRQRDQLFLSRDEFNAWKNERDLIIRDIQDRQNSQRIDLNRFVPREETMEISTNIRSRIDKLYQLYEQADNKITELFKLVSRSNQNTSVVNKIFKSGMPKIQILIDYQNDWITVVTP